MRKMVARVLVGLLVAGFFALFERSNNAEAISADRQSEVLHRVVWDAFNFTAPTVEIRSARTDGSDQRVLFRQEKGFVLAVDLDRTGREVAFAPLGRQADPATLVVANVLTAASSSTESEV